MLCPSVPIVRPGSSIHDIQDYKTPKGLFQTVSRFISGIGTGENRLEWVRKHFFLFFTFLFFLLSPGHVLWLLPGPALGSFASSCPPNIQRMNLSAKRGRLFWCAEQTVSCHNASGCRGYKRLISGGEGRQKKSTIKSMDFCLPLKGRNGLERKKELKRSGCRMRKCVFLQITLIKLGARSLYYTIRNRLLLHVQIVSLADTCGSSSHALYKANDIS